MKSLQLLIIILFILPAMFAFGDVYKYVDDDGQVHYTNDPANIPAEKLGHIVITKEIKADTTPTATKRAKENSYQKPKALIEYDRQIKASNRKKILQKEKKQLEEKRSELLAEKRLIDENKSYQKRRHKRKYKNRPYIKDLTEKENHINRRLVDIDKRIKDIQSRL